ncbi:hypothetical protein GK047_28880 [Paenibacillus sp. SYP-B3998]|uniref:Uncharacterized protein n=1 Tax=Paenibacillus sp. SYP-B3998 TaxID=2678564 RepID=A0A6G4A7I3_9BACL|nr:hypothetical protein [Paenibacillus sp. SYP-B3998]
MLALQFYLCYIMTPVPNGQVTNAFVRSERVDYLHEWIEKKNLKKKDLQKKFEHGILHLAASETTAANERN